MRTDKPGGGGNSYISNFLCTSLGISLKSISNESLTRWKNCCASPAESSKRTHWNSIHPHLLRELTWIKATLHKGRLITTTKIDFINDTTAFGYRKWGKETKIKAGDYWHPEGCCTDFANTACCTLLIQVCNCPRRALAQFLPRKLQS